MARFAHNNAQIANISHMAFKLNCDYHPCISFKENTNPCSQSKSANELSAELRDLITVCQENLQHTQEL